MLLNCVEVTVRIHYKEPITGEWMYHDGVGASEIQTKKILVICKWTCQI